MSKSPQASTFKRLVGRAWMKLFGWKTEGDASQVAKAVFIAAPHTSNWDLPFTLGTAWSMGFDITWAGKHTVFAFPFGTFFRWLGGMPVDRTQRTSFVSRAAELIRGSERMFFIIAPSGTRSRRETWKSGFYHLAREADVPILCGFIDFERKVGGIGPAIHPTGDLRADMDRIRAFYANVTPKHPAQWAAPRLAEELASVDVAAAAEE